VYKSTTKCNETLGKWCKNKHGASKIIDTFETYQEHDDRFGPTVEEKITVVFDDTINLADGDDTTWIPDSGGVAGRQRGEVCCNLIKRLYTKVSHSEALVDRVVHTRGFSLLTLRRFST
jgi:hypothetical protein